MIKQIIFFGQGPHIKKVFDWTKKNKISFIFITSPRLKQQEDVSKFLENKNTEKKFIKSKISTNFIKKIVVPNTIGISAGSPFIFSEEIIKVFKKRIYNLHDAPLPEYRGAASLSWMILKEKRNWKSTIHEVTKDIDGGNIVFEKKFKFPNYINKPIEYMKYQWEKDLIAIESFLNILLKNKTITKISKKKNCMYYPRLNAKLNGWIDFSWKANFICKFINAFSYDYAGARSMVNDNLVIIFDAMVIKNYKKREHPFLNGLIVEKSSKNKLKIIVEDGEILVTDYRCKVKIREGDRIYTPTKKLDTSYGTRARFCP